MNKIKLLALACSWILGAMLLISNPANASEIVGQMTSVLSIPSVQTVNLPVKNNAQNSPLTLTAKDKINPTHQFGCGCSTCQKGFTQLQGRLPGL